MALSCAGIKTAYALGYPSALGSKQPMRWDQNSLCAGISQRAGIKTVFALGCPSALGLIFCSLL